ncbi:MAG: CpaF family protein, partial [Brevundimonas sp.]
MFGKRTGQPGSPAPAAPRPAAAPQSAPMSDYGAPEPVFQPQQGVQTQAFAFNAAETDVMEAPRPAAAARPPSDAADRLDALAARPKPAAPAPKPGGPGPKATPGFEQLKKAQQVAEIVREQSDYYHATKTTIFNALMNTIDLAQLAQLDPKAAAEEIRDIVAELVAIKNVSMSVAEQEHLVQDIVNDVLGYGPLEPLLARDDIADIMVNGAGRVFIEVSGKVQLT